MEEWWNGGVGQSLLHSSIPPFLHFSTWPSVLVRKRSRRETHLIIELTEGRNREIRRLLAGTGHEVTKLRRVGFGAIELGSLQPGEWRNIPREEIETAFRTPGERKRRRRR